MSAGTKHAGGAAEPGGAKVAAQADSGGATEAAQADSGGATEAAQAETADTEKYLVFSVAEEKYAVEVVRVEEVIEAYGITPVPRTPDYLLGIVNLRGRIVPVLCVRQRFGFEPAVTTTDTRLVVLQVRLGEELVSLGAVLDAVHGVVDISPSDIEKRPVLGNNENQQVAVTSIAKFEGELLLVLNADLLLTNEYLEGSYDLLHRRSVG